MEITPDGAEAGTDVTEADVDLDSALASAWESTDFDEDEATQADEAVDTDSEDEDDEGVDEVDDEADGSDDEGDDTDDSDTPEVQLVTVKVNGETLEVPLEEALNGYMRQSDYTQKTQLLAQDREKYAAFDALNEALQQDAAGTLAKLSRLYGVELGQPEAQDTPDPLEDLDPALAAEIREMRQLREEWQVERAQRQAAEQTRAVDAEIEALRTTTQDPSLATEQGVADLLQFAIDNQIPSLELAHELKTAREAKAAASAEKPKVKAKEAKRKAPPVEGGRNRSNVTKGVAKADMTVDAAFEAALAELG